MVLFQVTLNDPNYPKPPHFRHFITYHIIVVRGDTKTSNLVGRLMVARPVVNKPFLKGRGQLVVVIPVLLQAL